MNAASSAVSATHRPMRSERLLTTLAPFERITLVTHVNPDPDALASMLGLQALISARLPGKPVTLTLDGIIARAENQAMVDLVPIPLVPVERVVLGPRNAVVMVDSQPNTGRRGSEAAQPQIILDHHETPGTIEGVLLSDIRPNIGATCTLVTSYLIEQGLAISPRLATALYYGIDSEISGYPREAGPLDDGALVWLFPRADKDLLARIRNPRLPQSYFATYQHALNNAFIFDEVVVAWCGTVPQPDIIAELADFFIRFDQVSWSLTVGVFENLLKCSARTDHIGGHCGEVLRSVVNGIGSAGGHDKRAGGAIPMTSNDPETVNSLRKLLQGRFLERLRIDPDSGMRLLSKVDDSAHDGPPPRW